MVKNLNILFHIRRDKADSTGNVPIYCRVTVNGKRAEIATKQYVQADKWNASSESVKGTNEMARTINSNLETIWTRVNSHIQRLEATGLVITAQAIKNSYLGLHEVNRDLLEVFEEHNRKVHSLVNKQFSLSTACRYDVCLKHIREFIHRQFGAKTFDLKSVNPEFVTEFDYYLRFVRGCNNNSTIKYIRNFKKVIRETMVKGWLEKDPFTGHKSKLEKVDRGYLTQQELERIETKVFGMQRIQQVADIFMFQCYTGLAYIDVKNLKPSNLKTDANGQQWLSTKRQKTKAVINIPLLDKAVSIIQKYKDNPECLHRGVVLPVLSNQKVNSYLKEIADLCEIGKNLSSHVARHSFATSVTLANGMSLESVSACLGHSNLKTTKIYAKMLDSRVATEMLQLNTKLN